MIAVTYVAVFSILIESQWNLNASVFEFAAASADLY